MEKHPLNLKIGNTVYPFTENDVCIEMFRPKDNPTPQDPDHSDRDYIAVLIREEGEEPKEFFIFDRIELLTWLGGVALGRERERILHLTNRTAGTARQHLGWNPDVYIKDRMIPEEEIGRASCRERV